MTLSKIGLVTRVSETGLFSLSLINGNTVVCTLNEVRKLGSYLQYTRSVLDTAS